MSWLYSIFLAGLALSNSSQPVKLPASENITPASVVRADETEHFDQTYPLSPSGRVSLSNINGDITVEAWDRSEVRVEYTKTADTKERLADVEVRIDPRADAISIEADYNNWKRRDQDRSWKFGGGKLEVQFHLMVPRGAALNEIEAVNGSVTVSNFTNFTKVSAVNGTVNASNIRGTARLSTVNGEVRADFEKLESGSRISLDTVNGRVALAIPSDSSATVKADSLNGTITNDFNLPVRKGKYVGRDLYGRLGGGDVQIKLSSVNGGLAVNRRNDGRSLSPSTNLLPEKGKDDEDWDGDIDTDADAGRRSSIDNAKLNRDIQKSVKQSQKAAAKAAADARAEMVRVAPEIARAVADSAAGATAAALDSAELQRSIRDAVRQQAQLARAVNASFIPGVPRVETKTETFTVRGVPTVTVEGTDCSVKIVGWDRPEVRYRVVRLAHGRLGSVLGVTALHSDTSVDLKVLEDSSPHPPAGEDTRIELMVPKKSNLKIRVDGEVRLEGVSGELDVDDTDSSVNVRDSGGRLHVATNDGRVRVIGFRGDVDVETGDAPVSLEGELDSLSARSGTGAVNLILPTNYSADLESNCSSVAGDGIAFTRTASGEERCTYRIGSGGKRFRVDSEGAVTVRTAAFIAQAN
jgi:DUF4097 and DUF4098 domain-containing protein YvlB